MLRCVMKSPLPFGFLLAGALVLPLLAAGADSPKAAPKLYVYCLGMGVRGTQPQRAPEQAKLLRELGFDGLSGLFLLDADLEAQLRAIDAEGVEISMLQLGLNVNPAQPAYDPRLPGAIRKLKGRATTVSLTLNGLKPADPAGMDQAVKALRELGDVAADAGLRISVYHHVNCWSERLDFVTQLVQQVNHPQVGFNFNLCHWLKVEGSKDYRPILQANAAKLFCVTICGAQMGATTWTNGLIQPLDKGDFDNRALLRFLDDCGYRGPVGLMCFGVPDDARDHLTRSLRVWKSWFANP